MGFIDDVWCALLSDAPCERDAALDRVADHDVASAIARSLLPDESAPETARSSEDSNEKGGP
ncbi:hypothetical protein [Candidatus Poriferisodalis sp.]|uniref:hypothetical protein n=1 Tax=Candidatus Poriferisodalis sp. TaxID=3101277 RepID=UPI003B010B51